MADEMKLTHINESGEARMVDVGNKDDTRRVAIAEGHITMTPETLKLIMDNRAAKGDVLGVARIAGIMAAKKTPDFIPLCHTIPVHSVEVNLVPDEKTSSVLINATVVTTGKTGVEMEALTAVSVAGLTVYDMVKAVDRAMVISNITLVEKKGGKSGHYVKQKTD